VRALTQQQEQVAVATVRAVPLLPAAPGRAQVRCVGSCIVLYCSQIYVFGRMPLTSLALWSC
jgi:hypothetical protein